MTSKELTMPTLESIQARMKKLQAQADALIAKKAQIAVDQIRALMLKHGLTTEDIEARAKARREGKAAAGRVAYKKSATSAAATKGKMPAKYRDPKTGATWSGHARPPQWIKDVKDRTKFLIDGAGAATDSGVASKAKSAAKKSASVKKVAAKKVAAKKSMASKKGARKVPANKAVPAVKKAAASRKSATPALKKTRGRKAAASKTATAKT
jgi:DNA-binding protein H-NS